MAANVKVIVKDGNFERALMQFKNKVEAENVIKEYRDRMFFKSKSEIRKERNKAARKKQLKYMRKQKELENLYL